MALASHGRAYALCLLALEHAPHHMHHAAIARFRVGVARAAVGPCCRHGKPATVVRAAPGSGCAVCAGQHGATPSCRARAARLASRRTKRHACRFVSETCAAGSWLWKTSHRQRSIKAAAPLKHRAILKHCLQAATEALLEALRCGCWSAQQADQQPQAVAALVVRMGLVAASLLMLQEENPMTVALCNGWRGPHPLISTRPPPHPHTNTSSRPWPPMCNRISAMQSSLSWLAGKGQG